MPRLQQTSRPRQGSGDPRDDRAKNHPRALLGILGIRAVNLGQYLTGGDAVVPLQSLNPIYVNFGVPQQDAGQIRLGRSVHITAAISATSRSTAGSAPSTQ